MAAKKSLVVIVGAGASVKAGIPGTADLGLVAKRALPALRLPGTTYTASERGATPFRVDQDVSMADILDAGLRADYNEYDFELLLHALEQLETFTSARYVSAHDANRFVIGAFAEIMRRFEPLNDPHVIREARWSVIKALHARVGDACDHPLTDPRPAREQLDRIFSALAKKFRLVVIDFNYDDLIDRTNVDWSDGFTDDVPDHFCKTFSPKGWADAVEDPTRHLLMHVHGSVRFAFKQNHLLTPTTLFSEPAKYDHIATAQEVVAKTRTGGKIVDGQVYDGGIIISGLGKAGKIAYNARPYGYYHQAIARIVPFAERLLVLGYGWRDAHINAWIDEMIDLQPNRRCAVVTYRPGAMVGSNMSIEYQSLNRLAGNRVWPGIDSFAFHRPGDKKYPTFFSKGDFAIAPGGFVLDDKTENKLLGFISK